MAEYVTDSQGQTKVILPVEVWEALLDDLRNLTTQHETNLDSKHKILEDIKESIRQGHTGQTFPLSELWDEVSV